MSPVPNSYDAIVIGGGVAGAAAAYRLARSGCSVALFEKDPAGHPKVCGEFLSADTLSELEDLEVAVEYLGATPLDHMRIVHQKLVAEAGLPFVAASLSRQVLDRHLLGRAEASGAEVVCGARVLEVTRAPGNRWDVRADPDRLVNGGAVFLATGKHDLPGFRREFSATDPYIGFKTYVLLRAEQTAALGRAVEIILFDGGYAGLQPARDGAANLCLVVRKSVFLAEGKSWAGLLRHLLRTAPHMQRRLDGADPVWDRPVSISPLPFGYGPRRRRCESGFFRLGDQMCVLPAIVGDGISVALQSARLACACFLSGSDSGVYGEMANRRFASSRMRASSLSGLATWSAAQRPLVKACRAFPSLLKRAASISRTSVQAKPEAAERIAT